mmetsp:Transcript_60260/g.179009  ORF Transcript_60260/g.179009 Transcript_60260/m.179009 type:complete len:156 (-) Transcript_60260:263-730(-)
MLFSKLDKDASGALEWSEFYSFYRKCLASERARKKFAARALQQMAKRGDVEARAHATFEAFDKDRSSTIEVDELKEMLQEMLPDAYAQMGAAAWDAFVADTLRRGDKDANNKWDLPEFVNFYKKCLASETLLAAHAERVLLRYQESSGELVIVDA